MVALLLLQTRNRQEALETTKEIEGLLGQPETYLRHILDRVVAGTLPEDCDLQPCSLELKLLISLIPKTRLYESILHSTLTVPCVTFVEIGNCLPIATCHFRRISSPGFGHRFQTVKPNILYDATD